jgi:lipopolysaccharide export LptBFGC system permease protein LptF
MVITDSTINSSVFETIYDKLYNNIGSYTSSTQPTISAKYIEKEASFPCIIVEPITKENSNYTFNQNNPDKNILVVISIYCKKNKDRDLLRDSIEALLKTPITGLQMTNYTDMVDFNGANQNRIFSATISISYIRK